MNWGIRLKKILDERGIRQAELAKRSGLSDSYISRVCSGGFKGVRQHNFARIARALGMLPDGLTQEMQGKHQSLPKETSEEILERLRLAQPISVPVYADFPFRAGGAMEVIDYVYLERNKGAGKNIEAYPVRGQCLEPAIHDGDIIIIDRDRDIEAGDIIACLMPDGLRIGRLRRVAEELWLETNEGSVKFEGYQVAAPVIQLEIV